MPDPLLVELETATPVAVGLETIADLVRLMVRQANWVVEGMKGSARAFENAWHLIILEVVKGQTAEVQADRPRLLSAFETRLGQLRQARHLVGWLSALDRSDLPNPDVLSMEIEGMEKLKARVFDHWHSADDLERLAVEQYPLSQSRLAKIAATHAPPAEWYEESEERLFQE